MFLKLKGRPCTVVGGGEVAYRKVLSLMEIGARVKVIASSLSPGLQELAGQGAIEAQLRSYVPEDLTGAFLVIAATDDPQVNSALTREAAERGILINVVDNPEECDFIVPSVVRRGELVIAISTGGLSPAFSRRVREEIEQYFGEEYSLLLKLLSRVRQELHRRGEHPPARAWQQAMDGDLLELLRQGEMDRAEQRLVGALKGKAGK